MTGERRRRVRGDRRSQELGNTIAETMAAAIDTSLYPKSRIDIYVNVLQADGGNVCAAINAACLALVDAGIPMRDLVSSCAAGIVDGELVVDPNHAEENARGAAPLPIALLPGEGHIVYAQLAARVPAQRYETVQGAAVAACRVVHEFMVRVVRAHALELAEVRGSGGKS
jgi:exosome complex component RRP41